MKRQLLFLSMVLISGSLFAQTRPAAKKDTATAAIATVPPAKNYAIVLSENEVIALRKFILTADIFSDKGRELYADELWKHIIELPPPVAADSAKKSK